MRNQELEIIYDINETEFVIALADLNYDYEDGYSETEVLSSIKVYLPSYKTKSEHFTKIFKAISEEAYKELEKQMLTEASKVFSELFEERAA